MLLLKELRTREDIVIVPMDKGRTIVIMDKEECIKKVEELLQDKSVYKPMNTNPVKRLDNKISNQGQWRMKSNEPVLPRFYRRPRIHKSNIPPRPI